MLLSMRTEDGIRRLNSCCYEMKTEDCVRLPRSPCGSKQRYVLDHGRRREFPTLGGILAPSQADLPPRVMRGERLELREARRTEGVLLVISRSTAHIAIACSFHSAEDQAFPLAAGTAPQIGKPVSCKDRSAAGTAPPNRSVYQYH